MQPNPRLAENDAERLKLFPKWEEAIMGLTPRRAAYPKRITPILRKAYRDLIEQRDELEKIWGN